MARRRHTSLPPPYLKRVWFDDAADVDCAAYPFCLPFLRSPGFEIVFDRAITIIAGENGVGKSTLFEGIAVLAGFDQHGGGSGYRAVKAAGASDSGGGGGTLAKALKGSWLPKIGQGWFFRAESFFSVARYLDEAWEVGGPDFLSHSHGEGFLRFFEEQCERPGLFIFDEPESALSPRRQFEFLRLLDRIRGANRTQVILATHSPILMALPGAALLGMGRRGLAPVELEDTDHFRIMRQFAIDPHGTVADHLAE